MYHVFTDSMHTFAMLLLITINRLISQFKNVSPVMHPRIKLKITKLFLSSRTATR
jgi:hypothetical protein